MAIHAICRLLKVVLKRFNIHTSYTNRCYDFYKINRNYAVIITFNLKNKVTSASKHWPFCCVIQYSLLTVTCIAAILCSSCSCCRYGTILKNLKCVYNPTAYARRLLLTNSFFFVYFFYQSVIKGLVGVQTSSLCYQKSPVVIVRQWLFFLI